MLDIFALLVLLILVSVSIWLIVLLGGLPGKMAREAGHPQAAAINMLAWVGVLTLGIGWFAALVWARYQPAVHSAGLEQRIAALESRLAEQESAQ